MKIRILIFIFSTGLIAISYQNCSVYKSEGRDLLSQNGVQAVNQNKALEDQIHSLSGQASGSCAPYITIEDAQSVYPEYPLSENLFVNERNEAVCSLIYQVPESESQIRLLCKISDEYKTMAEFPEQVSSLGYEILDSEILGGGPGLAITVKQDSRAGHLLAVIVNDSVRPENVGCSTLLPEDVPKEVVADLKEKLLGLSVEISRHRP